MGWIAINDTFLSQNQMMNNAQLVVNHFINSPSGWVKESLSALIGNMCHESSLNPQMHELGYGDSPSRGYGVVQWTPMTKYTSWASSMGLDYTSGDSQMARIDYEVNNNIQWINKSSYGNMTFAQFRQNASGASVDYLTEAFCFCYERPNPAVAGLTSRQSYAHLAYNTLDWSGTSSNGGDNTRDGSGTPPPTTNTKRNNLIMLWLCDAVHGWK
jgi:hypothetical protein